MEATSLLVIRSVAIVGSACIDIEIVVADVIFFVLVRDW